MDSKTRAARQREFTLYLVLFILLVIVGAVGYNKPAYPNYYGGYPYGYGVNPYYGYGGYQMYGGPFGPGYWGGPPMGGPGWW